MNLKSNHFFWDRTFENRTYNINKLHSINKKLIRITRIILKFKVKQMSPVQN